MEFLNYQLFEGTIVVGIAVYIMCCVLQNLGHKLISNAELLVGSTILRFENGRNCSIVDLVYGMLITKPLPITY